MDTLSVSSSPPPFAIYCIYSGVCNDANDGFLYILSSNEEHTTETELAAIAADAIHGSSIIPNGLNTPAANGMPRRLKMLANRKFKRIRLTVRRDKSRQATTSRRSFYKKKKKK